MRGAGMKVGIIAAALVLVGAALLMFTRAHRSPHGAVFATAPEASTPRAGTRVRPSSVPRAQQPLTAAPPPVNRLPASPVVGAPPPMTPPAPSGSVVGGRPAAPRPMPVAPPIAATPPMPAVPPAAPITSVPMPPPPATGVTANAGAFSLTQSEEPQDSRDPVVIITNAKANYTLDITLTGPKTYRMSVTPGATVSRSVAQGSYEVRASGRWTPPPGVQSQHLEAPFGIWEESFAAHKRYTRYLSSQRYDRRRPRPAPAAPQRPETEDEPLVKPVPEEEAPPAP